MALVIGLAVAILGQFIATVLQVFSVQLPFGESGGFSLILGGVIALHSLVLGTVGALVGSVIAARSKAQQPLS